MVRSAKSLLLMGLLLLFGIFYGIHMTTAGIEQVNGSYQTVNEDQTSATDTVLVEQKTVKLPASVIGNTPVPSDSFLHRMLDGTGKLVTQIARKTLEGIVYVFDQVMD